VSPRTRLILSVLFVLLVFPFATALVAQIDPVGEITLNPSGGSFRGVAEKDGFAYVATSYGDFAVFDVRSLSIEGPFRTFNSPLSRQNLDETDGVVRYGNFLYVFGWGIRVFDITNPANPVAGVHLTDYSLANLVRSGDYLFGVGADRLVVYSISNPSNPSLVATTTLGGRYGFAVTNQGEHVYVGELVSSEPKYQGLRVFAWNGGSTLTSVFEQATERAPYHLFVLGSYLIDTDGHGVRTWSLADPARPVMVLEKPAAGRAALRWRNLLITNGRVLKLHGPLLEDFSTFTAGGSQGDGFPFGAAGNADFFFIGQQSRVLVLTTPPTLVFPQYANGLTGDTRNRSRIILRNEGSAQTSGSLRFLDGTGAPNPIWIGGETKSEAPYSIPAGGTFQLLTDGTGALRFGPLEVRSDVVDSEIRGTEIFDLLGYSASVQEAPLSKIHVAFVSWSTTENTALAMYNPSLTTAVQVRAELYSKAGTSATGPQIVDLAARHQTSIFVDDPTLFQSHLGGVGGSFEGTLKLTVINGGPISVASLIQNRGNGSLLVVPVASTVVGP